MVVLLFGLVAAAVIVVSLIWASGVRRWLAGAPVDSSSLPKVTVIIAARNEEQYIEACVRSVIENDYPANELDVICIDDGSTDGTRAILETIRSMFADRVTVADSPSEPASWAPKKRAILHALKLTDSEIVMLTDADTEVSRDWVRSMVREFHHDTGSVIGASMPRQPRNLMEAFYRFERLFVNFTMVSAVGWGTPASASGQNIAYRRTALSALRGLPHPTLPSGDDDLAVQAIAREGWKIRFASSPQSVVTDCRVPNLTQNFRAAIRHQSTVRYYPRRWRALYIASIVSHAMFIAASVAALFLPVVLPIVAAGWVGKFLGEAPSATMMCRRLGIAVTAADLAFAEIVLPFYAVFKPALAIFPSYRWKGRRHAAAVS